MDAFDTIRSSGDLRGLIDHLGLFPFKSENG